MGPIFHTTMQKHFMASMTYKTAAKLLDKIIQWIQNLKPNVSFQDSSPKHSPLSTPTHSHTEHLPEYP